MSSIYYIEDIDSLRFALSIFDQFNLEKLQPHFPGYPVFCFLGYIFYSITGSLANTFSIIGSISIFLIIYFSLLLIKPKKNSLNYLFIILFFFLNPMFTIMSNRYMPDLFGLSLFVVSFYFLTHNNKRNVLLGGFIYGLLLGTRLSYFTLLLVPYIYIFYKENRKISLQLILTSLAGCLIWLIPMIIITGFENLVYLAQNQTVGHFTDYGGTILTEDHWLDRFKYFFHTIWSDGLGGYWIGRSNITLVSSLFLLPILFYSYKNIFKDSVSNKKVYMLIISVILYSIFIMLFQNIIYKSRHVMPIVFMIIILISFAHVNARNFNSIYKLSLVIHLLTISIISTNLSIQHKELTAVAKLREYLISQKSDVKIFTNPLINYYLTSTGAKVKFVNSDDTSMVKLKDLESQEMIMIGDYHEKIDKDIIAIKDTAFYHNPYVNRMWSTINVYKLNKNLNE